MTSHRRGAQLDYFSGKLTQLRRDDVIRYVTGKLVHERVNVIGHPTVSDVRDAVLRLDEVTIHRDDVIVAEVDGGEFEGVAAEMATRSDVVDRRPIRVIPHVIVATSTSVVHHHQAREVALGDDLTEPRARVAARSTHVPQVALHLTTPDDVIVDDVVEGGGEVLSEFPLWWTTDHPSGLNENQYPTA